MDLIFGAGSGVSACFFTNPLEVVKTRLQLQGELMARGHYAVHYRNILHAALTIARHDGILALQKGLVPAIWYQGVMNAVRLGLYQIFVNNGWTKGRDWHTSLVLCAVGASVSGACSGIFASPFFMVLIFQHFFLSYTFRYTYFSSRCTHCCAFAGQSVPTGESV